MGKKKAVLSITASIRSKINDLVEHLSEFLPLDTYKGESISFRSLFDESSIGGYLPDGPKKPALREGFTEVFRYHKRLPKKLIQKIVPAGIEYGKFKRRPITRVQIEKLNQLLLTLDIDIESDLSSLNLDENLPQIKIPPAELLNRLRNHNLMEELQGEVVSLFADGHFNESVRKACEIFENEVQRKISSSDIGKSLMGKVFNVQNPLIKLTPMSTQNEISFQEGFQLMSMGAMAGIRNIFSHGNEDPRTPEESFELLMYINWMFRVFKEA